MPHLLLGHHQLQVGQRDAAEAAQHNVALQAGWQGGGSAARAQGVSMTCPLQQRAAPCRAGAAAQGQFPLPPGPRSKTSALRASPLTCMNLGSASLITSTSLAGICGAHARMRAQRGRPGRSAGPAQCVARARPGLAAGRLVKASAGAGCAVAQGIPAASNGKQIGQASRCTLFPILPTRYTTRRLTPPSGTAMR